ncbi:alpha/beta hydrolase [Streptomyces pactum]|uniref:Alpha/beta hydrolase n=1 Tax=Streptomyces pactum TaxID=68249 RepID=A0ABS0NJZ7_9ACTN|nr:alpha/beta hydrolase [Streptomyces pactum]
MGRRTVVVAASAVLAGALPPAGGAAAAAAATTGDGTSNATSPGNRTAYRTDGSPGDGPAPTGGPGGVTLRLPAPTGPHPVGIATLHLVDHTRRDPWDPSIPVREVMVTVLYPARPATDRPVAPQMTPEAAVVFGVLARRLRPGLPEAGVDWGATATHAHPDAPALPGRRPVLLYSPGGGDPRTLGTAAAEELASRGYVVVTIDHPGDAVVVEFPGPATAFRDTVRTTVFRDDPRTDPEMFRTMIETRVADTRFVLDRLAELAAGRTPDVHRRTPPRHLGRALDLRRTGCYGHSAGGTTAAEAMYRDRRVRAAVTMEGFLDHPSPAPGTPGELFPVARYGVDRPLLLLGTDGFEGQRELETSWAAMTAHPGGHTHRRMLDRSAHWVFTDLAALVPQLQRAGLVTAGARAGLVGTVEPSHSVRTVRGMLLGFFARHLPVC